MNFAQRLPFLAALLIYVLWLSCFGWNRLDQEPVGIHQWTQTDRQALIRVELERIAGRPGLSRNTGEMVGRILGAGAA